MTRVLVQKRFWLLGVASILALAALLPRTGFRGAGEPPPTGHAAIAAPAQEPERSRPRVTVARPQTGGIPRSTTQPGTMESFDFADLYAKVSGYVKQQDVDIGAMVKRGQVLAIIDMPELEQELNRERSALAQAEAQVLQMEARVKTARAEFDASTAAIAQAEADLDKETSYLSFRDIQYNRVKHLFELKSVDERLVDEKHEQLEAARAAERAAKAAIRTSRAQAAAADARIAQAEADVVDAKAKVRLASANVAKAQVFVDYTKIVSPYDGVVTKRTFHVGDFIRAADQGGNLPLLTVARTDLMRVIVQVPERDVPYTNVGDPAIIELAALGGTKLQAKVSRIANSEDRATRTMRTEIDVPNTANRLRDGMFGKVTIIVDEGKSGLTIPSSSLVSNPKTKKDAVFVVRDGKARLTPVEVGQDNGPRTEIESGLTAEDQVIVNPTADLTDGSAVEVEPAVAGKPRPE
jgi:HlyD family secretion protein